MDPSVADFLGGRNSELVQKVQNSPIVEKRSAPVATQTLDRMSPEQAEALKALLRQEGFLDAEGHSQDPREQEERAPLDPQAAADIESLPTIPEAWDDPRGPDAENPEVQFAKEEGRRIAEQVVQEAKQRMPVVSQEPPPDETQAPSPSTRETQRQAAVLPPVSDDDDLMTDRVIDWIARTSRWTHIADSMWSEAKLPMPSRWPGVDEQKLKASVLQVVGNREAVRTFVQWARGDTRRVWGVSSLGRFLVAWAYTLGAALAVANQMQPQTPTQQAPSEQ